MKLAAVITFMLFAVSFVAYAQNTKITAEKSKEIHDFAGSIRHVEEFGSDFIAIKIIEAGRTISGYPDLPGMDVVVFLMLA